MKIVWHEIGWIVLGMGTLLVVMIAMAVWLRSLDEATCTARGLHTHEAIGRSIRLVCMDDQRRLVFP